MATHKLSEPVSLGGKKYEELQVRTLRVKEARVLARAMKKAGGDPLEMLDDIIPLVADACGIEEAVVDELGLGDLESIIVLMQGGGAPLDQPGSTT